MKSWRGKAQELIGHMCEASYRQSNTKKDGTRYKKHRAYSVPALAQVLIECLNTDNEEGAKRIFLDYDLYGKEYKE